MSHSISLRLAIAALLTGALLPLASLAQSQDSQTQSVADAARHAREQKKAATKPVPVITDDTLKPAPAAPASATATPTASPAPSSDAVPASSSAPAADAATAAAPDKSAAPAADSAPAAAAAPAEDDAQKAKDAAELANFKAQLADGQKAVDLLQRELSLDQDTVYSNPNYTDDPSGKSKLDDLK
ncbi:MAG: hypothetical protein WA853_10845, partial [Candidatus Acidiferrum sp.]